MTMHSEVCDDVRMATILEDPAAVLETIKLPAVATLSELWVDVFGGTGQVQELGLADDCTVTIHENFIMEHVHLHAAGIEGGIE